MLPWTLTASQFQLCELLAPLQKCKITAQGREKGFMQKCVFSDPRGGLEQS